VARHASGLFLLLASGGIALAGEDAQSLLGQALKQIDLNRYEEAAVPLERAVQLDPALAIARYDLGICYFALGRLDAARRSLVEAQRLQADGRFATYYLARLDLLEGHIGPAILGFESLSGGQPLADELYYLGSAYFRKGDFEAAVRSLSKAISRKPEDARAHFLLARVYRKLGQEKGAAEQFAASERYRSDDQQRARDILACDSAFAFQPPDAALARCRELMDGTDPTRLVSLGIALAERQLYEAAKAPLAKAERLDPENFEPHYNLGLTYFRLKDYAAARKPLESAAALRAEHFETVAVLGSTLFALGDDYGALRLLRRAHELRPGDEKVKALLFEQLKIIARHLVAKTEYAAAAPFLEEALQLKPEAPELHMDLAQVAAELGDSARAEREKALGESYRRRP
jgi:Flp pilus assembly protein TadD